MMLTALLVYALILRRVAVTQKGLRSDHSLKSVAPEHGVQSLCIRLANLHQDFEL